MQPDAPVPYTYQPPSGCSGAWSKVVLEADVSTAVSTNAPLTIWLGGVNLFLGHLINSVTTTTGASWHVERDLTDYAGLLRHGGQGQASIETGAGSGMTQLNARLLFYPASATVPASTAADAVYPVGSDPNGSITYLKVGQSLSATLSLPHNVERAYLDIVALNWTIDTDAWYSCAPEPYYSTFLKQSSMVTEECDTGNFREVEVAIDGQPAGVAPAFPWVANGTGVGWLINEYNFEFGSLPQNHQLDAIPERIDLTPFAGLLSDGATHEVIVSVAGNSVPSDSSFVYPYLTLANLLVYRDPGTQQITGQITRNDLVGNPPNPVVSSTLARDAQGTVSGNLVTTSNRHYVIEGYIDGSLGRLRTQVEHTINFVDTQQYLLEHTADINTDQASLTLQSTDAGISRTYKGALLLRENIENLSYPLHVSAREDSLYHQTHQFRQDFAKQLVRRELGQPVYSASAGNFIGYYYTWANPTQPMFNSLQLSTFTDSLGSCYDSLLNTNNGTLTTWTNGTTCPNQQNNVYWNSHPDGSPDNLGWIPYP